MTVPNVLAKALYDNVAESPDELSFRKGDIMTVLERDTQGLDGWWLCSLHGRQGIVPGNRLKILVGMYDKKPAAPGPGPPATPPQPQPSLPQGVHTPVPPASQYSPMLPTAYQPQPDNVYLVPTPSKTQQGLYQAPGPNPQFQSPPAKQTSTFSKQTPHHSFPSPATDLYQVPPGPGSPAQDIYQVPPSAGTGHDIYQVPPSLDTRSWEGTKPPAKVVVPTRVGQGYVYEASQAEQDEYDTPRHLLAPGSQDIYDVPPVRGLLPNQYGQEVYDTPPMAVKGPNGRDPLLDVYDVPPSVEKGLPPSNHHSGFAYMSICLCTSCVPSIQRGRKRTLDFWNWNYTTDFEYLKDAGFSTRVPSALNQGLSPQTPCLSSQKQLSVCVNRLHLGNTETPDHLTWVTQAHLPTTSSVSQHPDTPGQSQCQVLWLPCDPTEVCQWGEPQLDL